MCHGMTFEWVLAWFMGYYPPAKIDLYQESNKYQKLLANIVLQEWKYRLTFAVQKRKKDRFDR